jgi:hypothetical protein
MIRGANGVHPELDATPSFSSSAASGGGGAGGGRPVYRVTEHGGSRPVDLVGTMPVEVVALSQYRWESERTAMPRPSIGWDRRDNFPDASGVVTWARDGHYVVSWDSSVDID